MPQLSIYLPAKTADRLHKVTESEGISQSRWLAKLIENALDQSPTNSLKQLYGCLVDSDLARPMQPKASKDSKRLAL